MSGPFGSPQWMYSSGFYPHEIDNSVRFDNTGHFDRTPSSAGDKDEWTFSAWIKRSNLSDSGYNCIFSAGSGGVNRDQIYFDPSDKLTWDGYTGSSYDWNYISTQVFRDPSAWYHIVVVQDTSQSTASNRSKVYVNGEQITAWDTATNPNQYKTGYVSNTNKHTIGATVYDTAYFDGYITEVNFVDGQALDPSYFGETKADTWVPKAYTGSYGSLGYYLKFGNSSALGTDSSGNGNTWTATDVAATDQVPDSPTNNWATLNPLGPRVNGANFGTGTQTQGNLTATSTSTSYYSKTSSTIYNHANTGKWYYEIRMDSLDFGNTSGYVQFNIGSAYVWRYYGNSNTLISTGGSFTGLANGDIVMIAIDQDNGKGWFGINGSWYNVSGAPDPAAGTYPHTTFTTLSSVGIIGQVELRTGSAANTVTINFGQDSSFAGQATAQGNTDANGLGDFYYSPPAGFLALCSANMPDTDAGINPAVNNSPQDHFNTLLWSGDNTTRNFTGVGFAPDLVWIKSRSATAGHNVFDTVRGASKQLRPNGTGAENTTNEFGLLTAFNSDGFTTTPGSYSGYESGDVNMSGRTYVGWNWKAGGSGVSNSDGSITSTVSANTDAGFSIVTYTGDGASTTTIGHGLSQTPEMYIVKNRTDGSTSWLVYSNQIPVANYLLLDGNNASASAGLWGSGPTSSVITVTSNSQTNANTKNFIAYCFHSVEGFSKFGSYTGNGSTDGPFVHTGFRPAFVMIKRTDTTEHWHMQDSTRSSYNWKSATVYANLSNAEYTGSGFEQDYLSNGFKFRTSNGGFNASGGTYIYMAFAEMPFKYANAR